MKNIVYKFTTIKTGVLVDKSWSANSGDEDYYNRETENYAFGSYEDAAEWLKTETQNKEEEK